MAYVSPKRKDGYYEPESPSRHGMNRQTFNGFTGSDTSLFGGLSPEDNMKRVKEEKSVKDTNDSIKQNFNHLIHIKDHTQTIAVVSMLVLHVAWLKNIIDTGGTGGKLYYKCSLGLVTSALAFLITAGLIIIYVAYLRYYQLSTNYHSLNTCSTFKCKPTTTQKENNSNLEASMDTKVKTKLQESSMFDDEIEAEVSCCQNCCLRSLFNNPDDYILDLYSTLSEKALKANIQTANFDMDTQWLVEKVTRLNNELQKYETVDIEDEAANNDYLQNIRDQLMEAQMKKNEMEQKSRIAMQLDSQVALLKKHVYEIKENQMMKKTFFWITLLNVIMYIVLLLNIAIVGIGFAKISVPEQLMTQ